MEEAECFLVDREISILANVNDERRSKGRILIREFNHAQRVQAAIKILALIWGSIILVLPIPMIHFVLPPVLFFTGIFISYRTYKSTGRVLSGATTCPNCKAAIVVGNVQLHWPVTEICQECGQSVRMVADH